MHFSKIPPHEADFAEHGRDSDNRPFQLIRKAIEIFGDDRMMPYVDCRPADGDDSYFFRSRPAKDQIVLHFTMGYVKGDVKTLTQPDYHVSVPFLVARDGTIYNLFNSFYWSYHLGRGTLGGNRERSRATIGIELSNIGPLVRRGDDLHTTYARPHTSDDYCTLADEDRYRQVEPFREEGYEYFATFPDAQIEALILLLRYLTARYDIEREFLSPDDRYRAFREVRDHGGIVSHVNYRRTGKVDIGPAFDWERVIAGVQA